MSDVRVHFAATAKRHGGLALLVLGLAVGGQSLLPGEASGQIMPPSLRAYAGIDTTTVQLSAVRFTGRAEALELRRAALESQATELERGAGLPAARDAFNAEIARLEGLVASISADVLRTQGALGVHTPALQQQLADSVSVAAQLQELEYRYALALGAERAAVELPAEPSTSIAATIQETGLRLADLAERIAETRQEIAKLDLRVATLESQLATYRADIQARRSVVDLLEPATLTEAVTRLRQEAQARAEEARVAQAQADSARAEARRIVTSIRSGFAPVRTAPEAALFFNEEASLTPGRSANLTIGADGNGSVTAELVRMFAGPVRLLVSGVVAKADDEDEEETGSEGGAQDPFDADRSDIRRFFAGGGNLVVSAAYPAAAIIRPRFTGVVQLLGKWATDMPGGGVQDVPVSSTNMNIDGGTDVYFSLGVDDEDRFRVFGFARLAGAMGTSRFYSGIGLEESPFAYGQLLAGGEIRNFARVLFTRSYGQRSLDDPWRFTIQMTP